MITATGIALVPFLLGGLGTQIVPTMLFGAVTMAAVAGGMS